MNVFQLACGPNLTSNASLMWWTGKKSILNLPISTIRANKCKGKANGIKEKRCNDKRFAYICAFFVLFFSQFNALFIYCYS